MLAASEPLHERLLVAATAPVLTVLVGGLLAWGVTDRVQHKRAVATRSRAEDRENAQSEREVRARDDALRHELVDLMTDSASTLYLMTQHYWRAKRRVQEHRSDVALGEALRDLRPELDAAYLRGRASGESIENRLWGYFLSEEPRDTWHQVQDLLTVRCLDLIDEATDRFVERNAGDQHSRLDAEELRNTAQLLRTYRDALKETVRLVFSEDLRSRSETLHASPRSAKPDDARAPTGGR